MQNVETKKSRWRKDNLIKQVKKRIPFFGWISDYKTEKLLADAIAGITVGLTIVPQSLAYAAIAGLSPEYGLYSSYWGAFLYVFLGSCRQVSIGPTAVMGLFIFETCGSGYASCAILSTFWAGVFELLMWSLQLGWIVCFISEPVVIGFTAGAATTIMSSQIKSFLGIKGPKGNGFLGCWASVFRDIQTISASDSILGISAFAALFFLKELKDFKFTKGWSSAKSKKGLWLLSLSRNVIVLMLTTILSFLWKNPPYALTGHVHGGFPPVKPPDFLLPRNPNVFNNLTVNYIDIDDTISPYYSFWETMKILGGGPLIMALVSVLQNVSISKAFGTGQNAGQEMFALGFASVVSSFFSSIPISGSFSRSAVNNASGVQSPLGGLFTGILVLLSLGVLTPSFHYIPKSSLAAVIISAVLSMIEIKPLFIMWKIKRLDTVICLFTYFSAILLGLEFGILVGVSLSVLHLLLKTLKPAIKVKRGTEVESGQVYILLLPDPGLTFQSVDHIREQAMKLSRKNDDAKIIALDFRNWAEMDYSSVVAISSLISSLEKEGKDIVLLNCGESWQTSLKACGSSDLPIFQGKGISSTFKAFDVSDSSDLCVEIDCDNSSNDTPQNPTVSEDTFKPLISK